MWLLKLLELMSLLTVLEIMKKGSLSSSIVASGSKEKDSSKTRLSMVRLLDEINSDKEHDIGNEFSEKRKLMILLVLMMMI